MKKEKSICKFYVLRDTIFAYISLVKGRENRIRINTTLKIDKPFWDVKKGRAKSQYADSNKLNVRLSEIENGINNIYDILITKYELIHQQSPEMINSEFMELYNKSLLPETKNISTFFECFDKFIQSKVNSTSLRTVKRLDSIKRFLLTYESDTKTQITFDGINDNFKVKFESYLTKKGYSDNYIAKIFSIVRQFMMYSFRNHYHKSMDFKNLSKTRNRADIFVLSQSEIETLYNFEFESDRLIRARDLFILQVELVQRHSDMSNLTKTSFYYDGDGDLNCRIRQQKTDNLVNIPLSPIATQIVNKYNFDIPKISNQRFNSYIKELCKLAGIDEIVSKHVFRGGKKTIEYKPKYEVITSHSARRTGATILVEKGIPIPFVMELTGHKTLSEFQKYVGKTDGKQVKSALKNIWNEKTNLKLVVGGSL